MGRETALFLAIQQVSAVLFGDSPSEQPSMLASAGQSGLGNNMRAFGYFGTP
jgi:hypothetical protein